ncbi:MAG: patatin-like phospholipase family protein [Xanthobacteraceae bacterium]
MPAKSKRTSRLVWILAALLAAALIVPPVVAWLVTSFVELTGGERQNRPSVSQQELLKLRGASDAQFETEMRSVYSQLMTRTKAEYDKYRAGARDKPPVINLLVVSSGGDYGAFGAGVLKGWQKIPAAHPLAKPEFDVVTGVSAGTLIAPFAFLGDAESIDHLVSLFRSPHPDWVQKRGPLYFLPDNVSFTAIPGLEREVRRQITLDVLRQIAAAGAGGRVLAVNTTNLDEGTSRVFNLVTEAQRAVDSKDLERFTNIMLASAGVPGVFPFRIIDGTLYVDGGVTGNIIYGGRGDEDDKLPAMWQKAYPDVPIPKIRMWIIFNNQFRAPPELTDPNWPAVVRRSLETATRASTAIALRHLYAMAEIARLKRKADVEVYVVSIPDDWTAPVGGTFAKETMNNLVDLGEKMGANPSSWSTRPPW